MDHSMTFTILLFLGMISFLVFRAGFRFPRNDEKSDNKNDEKEAYRAISPKPRETRTSSPSPCRAENRFNEGKSNGSEPFQPGSTINQQAQTRNGRENDNNCDRSGLFVLVVEDNIINQKLIIKMLKKMGCSHVQLAEDGSEAINKCEFNHYDLVFMDIRMPKIDGITASRIIRQETTQKGWEQPFICAVTASTETAAECWEAGMDEFLAKPMSMKALAGVVDHACIVKSH